MTMGIAAPGVTAYPCTIHGGSWGKCPKTSSQLLLPEILIITCGLKHVDYKWFGEHCFKKQLMHCDEDCSRIVQGFDSGICISVVV